MMDSIKAEFEVEKIMEKVGKILFWTAVFAAFMAALYFSINGQNYTYSFCYVVAAGLLLSTKNKGKDT